MSYIYLCYLAGHEMALFAPSFSSWSSSKNGDEKDNEQEDKTHNFFLALWI